MDHHCRECSILRNPSPSNDVISPFTLTAWLNNCVGHFNHRYFFMFCFYTWLATIFVFFLGIWIAYEHWFGSESQERQLLALSAAAAAAYSSNASTAASENMIAANVTSHPSQWWINFRHGCIVFECLSAGGVFAAVGGLMLWHVRLITKGETCVETYINAKERKRLQKKGHTFRSPFDNGWWNNWRLFLGFASGQSWLEVILPSSHPPRGDGLRWDYNKQNALF